jgi:hypothetical protein
MGLGRGFGEEGPLATFTAMDWVALGNALG